MAVKKVYNKLHTHLDDPFPMQKRSFEVIRAVKAYYHLRCPLNGDHSGDIKQTSSNESMEANQGYNPVHYHLFDQFPM